MGKILNFFTRRRKQEDNGRSYEEIRAEIESRSIPALMLQKTEASTKSYLGGDPLLPERVSWPSKDGNHLAFLAALDLEEVSATNVISWLPSQGRLLFFYDIENQPWGFDPKDRGGWAVLHVDEIGAEQTTQVPALPQRFVELVIADSLPDYERFNDLGIVLNQVERDCYFDGAIIEASGEDLDHQIGGYPRPVQGDDMEMEAQLASNGIYCGDGSGYQSEKGKQLASGKKDWRLLLQFGSDEDLDVMWGDAGYLYFWVREQDAIRGDFSGTWLVLQCS